MGARTGGVLGDPRWLAAGAGGLLAAVAALWAMRGLPLGGLLIWAAPLPLFLAGLGFGLRTAAGAVAVATAAVFLSQGGLPLLVFLLGFGLPPLVFLVLGLRGGQIRPSLPLAALGLWPALLTGALGLAFADQPGGLEGAMRRSLELSFARAGLDGMPPEAVAVAARLQPALLGALFACAMAANAALAQRLLARAGLALAPTPRWSQARLPGWYPVLPALALLWWLAAEPEGLALPIALALLVPVFLQGLAAAHAALPSGRPGRRAMLGGLYALILFPLTSTLAVLAVTVFGLIAQWRHPGGSATGPSSSGGTPT